MSASVTELPVPTSYSSLTASIPHCAISVGAVSMITGRAVTLPLEIWFLVLNSIERPRDLLACGCTCRALYERVEDMKFERRGPSAFTDLPHLHRQLLEDHLLAHFFRRLRVHMSKLNQFAYKFSGRLPGLRTVVLDGEEAEYPRPIRLPVLSCISHFKSVTELVLYKIVFWSSRDFLRLVCYVENLVNLRITDISWRRELCSLADEPFGRSLHLRSITIFDRDNLRRHASWLSVSSLRDSLSALTLQTSESLLSDWTSHGADDIVQNLVSLETLVFSFAGYEVYPSLVLPTFLAKVPKTRVSHIAASYSLIDDSPKSTALTLDDCKRCFETLDTMLTSPDYLVLSKVAIDLNSLTDEVAELCSTEPRPCPLLRARGILDFSWNRHVSSSSPLLDDVYR